jgi:hypothetical protein
MQRPTCILSGAFIALIAAPLASATGRLFRRCHARHSCPISDRSNTPAGVARPGRRARARGQQGRGATPLAEIVRARPRQCASSKSPQRIAAAIRAATVMPRWSAAPPRHRPRHHTGSVPRKAAVRSRGSESNHVPPGQGKSPSTLSSISPAPIACGDQMLGNRRGTDRHGQGGKQPERLRRPHGNPTAQHPGASDHVVHFAFPRAPGHNVSWRLRPPHALIQINSFINSGVRSP